MFQAPLCPSSGAREYYTQIIIYIYYYIILLLLYYIQGVSRLKDITAGDDFLGLCDQKSSYKMCPILDGYGVMGIFNPRKRPHVNRISWNQLAGDVLNLVAFLLRCQHYFRHLLAQFTTKRQPVLWPAVAFSKTSFKQRSIQIKGNFTKGTLHLYFKCIMYYDGLLFCSVYCQ